ncbi:NAD(P)-binding protein [Aspergillus venezuelensis]
MPLDRYAALHAETPQGRGDGRPTAEQIFRDQEPLGDWSDKVILITGGTAGLGAESTRVLHKTGAKIFIMGRDAVKGQKLADNISAANPQFPPIEVITMDQSSLQSVRDGAAEFLEKSGGKLNVFMANAGIVASPVKETKDGFEAVFAINYLSTFLLTQLLAPALEASTTPEFNSRLVVVSSAGHRAGNVDPEKYNFMGEGYDPSKAYARSKSAAILMANEFERKYGSRGVHALSLNPGIIMDTEISRDMPGTKESRRPMYYKMEPLLASWEKDVEQGAATQVWASIAKELEGKGGLYLDDVQVAKEAKFEGQMCLPGWKPWIWDEEMAAKLWKDSLEMVGLA